ncbi:MAG: polysaccharide deacetylase family protein [Hyphomicrobiaceae bacterium]
MRSIKAALAAAVVLALPFGIAAANACTDKAAGLGVARIVEIDASHGPIFGNLTNQAREERFLGPKEVVLTFDDGPMPGITKSILDTLDRFCTKATFFSVGRMAIAYPAMVKEVIARGHTMGTHTWSHPMNMARLAPSAARDQIDSGFAAVALAAEQPIAPFFRFPGLSDSPALMSYLQERGIAAFTVDVVSNDSYIGDVNRLIARTLERVEADKGGIILFHDIKHVTARALPTILSELKARGYKVVHMRAKKPYKPDDKALASMRETAQRFARGLGPGARQTLLAVTDGMSPRIEAPVQTAIAQNLKQDAIPVVAIMPSRRDRLAKPGVTAVVAKSEPTANTADTNLIAATGKEAQVTPAVQSVPDVRPSAPRGLIESWSTLFRSRTGDGGG